MATTTSSIDPVLKPYLEQGLQRTQQLFLQGAGPQFFSGQTYVSPSQQTLTALQQQEQLARQASPFLSGAQQTYLSNLGRTSSAIPLYQNIYGQAAQQPGSDVFQTAAGGGYVNPAMGMTAQTALGGFLQGSPYQQQMIDAATRPLAQQYSERVMPGIASQFSSAGRYGSGAMERAQGTATEAFGRAFGDVASNIVGQDYARERAFQEAARQQLGALGQQDVANRFAGATGLQQAQQTQLAAQLQAAGGMGTLQGQDITRNLAAAQAAPSFFSMGFLPSQALAQVGAGREAIAAQPLQEQMARFNYQQQLPYNQLSGYLSAIYGNPLRGYGSQEMPQAQTNYLAQGLGGAVLGSQVGGLFNSGFGGLSGSQTGAILGGLGGLLFR